MHSSHDLAQDAFLMHFVNITHDSNITPSIRRSEIIFVLSIRQPI